MLPNHYESGLWSKSEDIANNIPWYSQERFSVLVINPDNFQIFSSFSLMHNPVKLMYDAKQRKQRNREI